MKRSVQLSVGFVLAAVAIAVAVVSCRPPAPRPNFLLITVDTLRANHLEPYGYDRPTSPNLKALAESSAVFDNAFAQSTVSGPSHATLLTSLHVPVHGVRNNGYTLTDSKLSVAEILHAAGYETAMFVSHALVSDEFGFDQGFDLVENHHIDSHLHPHEDGDPGGTADLDAVFDAALSWVSEPRSGPFFAWLHVQHPHKSYEPPPPYDRMFGEPPAESEHNLRCLDTLSDHRTGKITLSEEEMDHVVALYDGEIAYVDAQLGRIFEALRENGLDENTVIVVTADHGEMLFDDTERLRIGHGQFRYEPVLRVPLIIHDPARPVGRRPEPMVGLIDVAPTLLERAGIHAPSAFQGTSLVPLLDGRDVAIRDQNYTWSVRSNGTVHLSVREFPWKLICDARPSQTPSCRLYDLERDPLEQNDVSRVLAHAAKARRLWSSVEVWQARLIELKRSPEAPQDERVREILIRAGYLKDGEPL